MTFDDAFTKLLGHEGGYSDNAADTGGKTMYGITETVARANGYTGDMRALPVDVAKSIYKASYWTPCKCDELPDPVAFDVFDTAVNSGCAQSIKFLQRALNIGDDGVIGPVTLKAVRSIPAYVVASRFNGQRLDFMTRLKVWPVFGAGWARRIASNLQGA